MTTREKIIRAAKDQDVVRIYRSGFEQGWAHGYIVATGPEFFALELIDDAIRFDGINCMRYEDVTECKVPHPYWQFVEKALELRGLKRMENLNLDLSSTMLALKSAATHAPLVTIHLEMRDPDCCYIGSIRTLCDESVSLLEISPVGDWESETETYALDQITRVDFGGAYEAALLMVAQSEK